MLKYVVNMCPEHMNTDKYKDKRTGIHERAYVYVDTDVWIISDMLCTLLYAKY